VNEPQREAGRAGIVVRPAREDDVPDIASMVDDFVKGHKAQRHVRSQEALRAAYFGRRPVAEIIVAEWRGRVVGMGQWARIYDMFWGMVGGRADWLYVRPEARGLGISFLCGSGNDRTRGIYERSAMLSGTSVEFHLSAAAFQRVADLAGLSPRVIVRGLPAPELNRASPCPQP
jgi:GNAT superfamily N-acetyltransferase